MDTPEQMDSFDAGELNTYGGGNVGWWIDYIRSLLGSAEDHYQHQHEQALTAERQCADELVAHNAVLREALQNTHDDLDGGFVACQRCGDQEDTKDLDVMSLYIKPALSTTPAASLDALTQRVRAEAMEDIAKSMEADAEIIEGRAAKLTKDGNLGIAARVKATAEIYRMEAAAIRQRAQEG